MRRIFDLCFKEITFKTLRKDARIFGRIFFEKTRRQRTKFAHFALITFAQYCTLVSCKDSQITIGVYRKATHTDRCLDFSSHRDKCHKVSTAETLLHCTIKLPSTSQGKNTEIESTIPTTLFPRN